MIDLIIFFKRVYKSFTHALQTIWKEEGIVGLYSPGLLASVIREACYSSLRIGLYPVIKKAIFNSEDGSGDIGFMKKFLAGMASGALGSALANPTDLVKIRLQVDSGKLVNGIYQVFFICLCLFNFFFFLIFFCLNYLFSQL